MGVKKYDKNSTEKSLLERTEALGPTLSAAAAANEVLGRLSPEVFDALDQAGYFRMMIPECLGGLEASPVEALEAVEALCYADGSTGWVVMAAGCCTAVAAALLNDAGVKEVFRDRIPVICGQGAANGQAVVDGNGYRLTGHWRYGSGVLHADYIHTGGMVMENGAPRMAPDGSGPEMLTFIVPKSEVEVKGNWDVMGLRATGSVDYTIDDVFVSADCTHQPLATDPLRGGSFYRIGILGMTQIGHTGFAIGIARRALDELATFIGARNQRRGPLAPVADTESFQEGYGMAEAKLRAARAFAFETWRDIERTLEAGGKPSTRQITLMRLVLNHVTNVAAEVCTYAYRVGGGYALRESALQRCFRDMYAGTQHFLTTNTILRECGRELAGLADGKEWSLLGLVDPPKPN